MQEWMRWQPTKARRFSSMLLEPARIVVGVGAAMAFIGGFMPWADGTVPGLSGMGPEFFSGLGGAGDGLVVILLSGIVGVLTLHRTPAQSRVRTVRLLPAIFVWLIAMSWISGYRAASDAIDSWAHRGGHGSIAPGLWLVGLGIVLMTAGTLYLLPPVLRWRSSSDDPGDLLKVTWGGVAVFVAALVGIVVGAAFGIELGLSITGSMVIMGALALGATFGGLAGAYIGAWAMRRVIREVTARRS